MSNLIFCCCRVRGAFTSLALSVAVLLVVSWVAEPARVAAATWGKIEPLKSRRVDVERELGAPLREALDESAALHFKVAGGTVTVMFVNAKFVATKKLSTDLEGTVLQIVLRHENSSATPDSLTLAGNKNFEREEKASVTHYRNLKDGLAYTFINGKLVTSRYSPSATQLTTAQK